MKFNPKILIVVAFIILISTSMVSASKNYNCAACVSPSGLCVVDEFSNVVIRCAVGCEETSELSGGAFCSYGPFVCAFYGGVADYTCKDGSTPNVRCSNALWIGYANLSDCVLECAAACGRRTLLNDDCENCTVSDMCSVYPVGSTMEMACSNTCFGVCESNKQFCGVIDLLRYAAMFAGVILLILHGFKWMASEDPEGKTDAKRGMAYVMFGLIVIVVASALVELMFFRTIIC